MSDEVKPVRPVSGRAILGRTARDRKTTTMTATDRISARVTRAQALAFMADSRARCRETDPEIFFPDIGTRMTTNGVETTRGRDRRDVQTAREICAGCELRRPCRDYGIRFPADPGIYGGLLPRERAAIRQQMRRGRPTAVPVPDISVRRPTTRTASEARMDEGDE